MSTNVLNQVRTIVNTNPDVETPKAVTHAVVPQAIT